MNGKKTTISSVLCQNFGIEDFQNGVVGSGNRDTINNYMLANKLGLLAPLADRDDTDTVTFGSEAHDLLGEAKQLNQYATNQIENINNRFAIANEIKKNYGVEGFDAFAFGCEGFVDKIKSAFTAIVAAIKKIIQSITNWIRQVMNWVGSQFAKLQEKLIEKYKSLKIVDNGATIKAIVPPNKISSGESIIKDLDTGLASCIKEIEMANKTLESVNISGYSIVPTTYKDAKKGVQGPIKALSTVQTINANTAGYKAINIDFKTYYGKHIDVVKLGSASKAANEVVWGTENPKKIVVSAFRFLQRVEWKTILSKADLKTANSLVKDGKELIKCLNNSLKTADKLAKSLTLSKNESNAKTQNNAVKNLRKQISILSNNNRVSSLSAGVLYGVFANYLKLRSYTASAIKAIAAGTKKSSKNKPNHAANARNMINEA